MSQDNFINTIHYKIDIGEDGFIARKENEVLAISRSSNDLIKIFQQILDTHNKVLTLKVEKCQSI